MLPVSGGVGLKPRVSLCLILELVFFSPEAITTHLFIILSFVHSRSSFLSCHPTGQALFQALSEPDEQERQERKQRTRNERTRKAFAVGKTAVDTWKQAIVSEPRGEGLRDRMIKEGYFVLMEAKYSWEETLPR